MPKSKLSKKPASSMLRVICTAVPTLVIVSALVVQSATAQAPAQSAPSGPVSAADRAQVIQAATRELNERYVFEDVAKKVGESLSQKHKANEYNGLDDAVKFAARLTDDIQAITKDKHIRVRYSASPLPERKQAQAPTESEIIAEKKDAARRNFGVERVERLPFNVGYIDLRGFEPADWAGEAISAAMSLVANTEALIIDLRKNGGGDPATVALMTSYLLDERTHLNSFYYRDANKTEQYWSHDWVPGKRFGGKRPVYVLTSKRTFSGAEEFSYNLKNLKRGTIIGETTGGGAHPGEVSRLTAHFTMFVPSGRAINPISKTNWEGVGVEPDVKVAADDALRVAQLIALKKLAENENEPRRAKAFSDRIAELEGAAPKS